MKSFITENFLLETEIAQELYHEYAKNQPIIDYHNHLPPNEIAEDRSYQNMTKLWLDGDHYKWRAMRTLGIDEKYITGNASDEDKFDKWAYTIPYTLRNPLYHWTHLELQRYFSINEILSPETSSEIYKFCNKQLKKDTFSTQGLLKKMNVKILCTTDDPLNDLQHHKEIAYSSLTTRVLPSFRPDGIINIESTHFKEYIKKLSEKTAVKIANLESLLTAIQSRIDYFHENGGRLSDHGLSYVYAEDFTDSEIDTIVKKKLSGKLITKEDILKFKSAVLYYLGKMYAEKSWTMQLHLGPIRNTNTSLLTKVGLDAGVDSIGDFQQAEALAKFLDRLNNKEALPKTIIYNSNPADNDVFATMAGNFSENGIRGKVQFGAAWWFLDQKDGITKQINSLSNMGLLTCSLGMLTDSRSFLSFPRHEYYRRILCNILGNDIKNGELPKDIKWIGKIIQDICYNNAKSYFNFPELDDK